MIIAVLIVINLCIFVYYHIQSCKPTLCEVLPGIYCLKMGNKYLDIKNYDKSGVWLWKNGTDALFEKYCTTKNKSKILGIINDIKGA